MLAAPGFAHADKIYQWVDEMGVTHFSDTPKDSASQTVEFTKGLANTPASKPEAGGSGSEIWQNVCSKCHHVGLKFNDEGLRGLPETMIRPVLPMGKLVQRLGEALSSVDEMADIKLTDEEITSLAEFITRSAEKL